MKKILSILLSLTLSALAYAQHNYPSLVSTAGSTLRASGGKSLSFNIGQYAVFTVKQAGQKTVDHGFIGQQTEIKTLIKKNPAYQFDMKIYPNPATDYLHIAAQGNDQLLRTTAQIEVFDIMGRNVSAMVLNGNTQFDLQYTMELNIAGLPDGQYLIRIVPDNRQIPLATFKVLKINK